MGTIVVLAVALGSAAWPSPSSPPPRVVDSEPAPPAVADGGALPEAPPSSDPELTIDSKGFAGVRVDTLALSPDGRWLAAGGGKEIRLWDLASGTLRATLRGYREPPGYKIGGINALAFSPDSRYLAVGVSDNSDLGSTRIYALDDPTKLHRVLPGHSGCTQGVAFSPDGRRLATYGCDRNLFVFEWDAAEGDVGRSIKIHMDEYEVKILPSLRGEGDIPSDGKGLLVVADVRGTLHFRIFEADGRRAVGTDETRLPGKAGAILGLKQYLDGLWQARQLSWGDRDKIRSEVMSIVGHTPRNVSLREKAHAVTTFGFPLGDDLAVLRWGEERFVASLSEGALLPVSRWPTALGLRPPWEASPAGDQYHWHASDAQAPEAWAIRGGETPRAAAGSRYWVRFWRGGTRPAAEYRGHRFHITAQTYQPATGIAASVDTFGDVHVWEASTARRLHLFASSAQPIYRVAWSADGGRLEFATDHYPQGIYNYNRYGPIDRAFDLNSRHIAGAAARPDESASPAVFDPWRRTVRLAADRKVGLDVSVNGQILGRTGVADIGVPTAFAFTRGRGGLAPPETMPFVVGSETGTLVAGRLDPGMRPPAPGDETSSFGLRAPSRYVGHGNSITAIAFSPDGRLMASSSLDGTIRIWPLKPPRDVGDVDFRFDGNRITEVPVGSEAAAAGLLKDDEILTFGDGRFYERVRGIQAGRFRIGQVVDLTYLRGGRPHAGRIRLASTADIIEPLLTLYVDRSGEWVAWTPQGYYDASSRGGEFVGWHVNRGRLEAADFYPLERFQSVLYRPDILNRIVATADVARAKNLADAELPRTWAARRASIGDLSRRDEFDKVRPPVVRIVRPADGQATDRAEVRLEVEVAAPPGTVVERVSCRLNGRLVPSTEAEGASPGARRYVAELRLLPGENLVRAVASNAAGVVGDAQARLVLTAAADPTRHKPRLFVLAMGVSKYRAERLNLRFADRDARAFAEALEAQEGLMYSKVESLVMTNEEATSQNFRKAMDWLDRSADDPRDVAMILISAHGLFDRGGMWHLGTHDTDPEALASTTVSFADIMRWLDNDLRSHTVLYVDTCFASGVGGVGAKGGRRGAPAFDQWRGGVGTFVLTSCLPNQSSYEVESLGHGAFTSAILDALRDPKADVDGNGVLTFTEMELYVRNEVPRRAPGPQDPAAHKPISVREIGIAARRR